ncbi:A-kinase anchor protein 6-like, partial [Cebidichthys violaceus]|uniref:A-kinase anchor protein 6-like n=1 Tax=Cebidichthys violaceus TaxID=271503 RepID=UPI0035CAAA74
MDPPDRSKFWLELDSVYPENVSQSYESLQIMNGRNLQRNHVSSKQLGRSQRSIQRPPTDPRSPSGARRTADAPLPPQDSASQDEMSKQMERTQRETHAHSEGDSDSSLPSPMRERFLSSNLEASGEESDPRPRPGKTAVWIVRRQGQKAPRFFQSQPREEHWYGSEEFLALPAQLRKTEMLAMKLESLAQSIPLSAGDGDSTQEALQDVDDWDLTDLGRRGERGRPAFSPASAATLQSEDEEGRRSSDRRLRPAVPPVDVRGGASLVQQLLEDIQSQDNDPRRLEEDR